MVSSAKPNVNSQGEKELLKAEAQLNAFEDTVKSLTLDRMNEAPRLETEPQTKMALKDIDKSKDIYIKPSRSIGSKEKFNEKFRDEYNKAREYVRIIAEHKELYGETLEFWTKPFPGMPAEFWQVPTNKAVWVHNYVHERIQACFYHRMRTEDRPTSGEERGTTFYGSMVVDNIIQRLDSREVPKDRRIYMGGGLRTAA